MLVRSWQSSWRVRCTTSLTRVWRENADHISVAQVWEDFTSYPYLPRLRDSQVLLRAVVDGPQVLNATQDGFGYAEAFDEDQCRYRGLVLHESATTASLAGVIVKYEVAKRQWDADQEAARQARSGGGDGDRSTAGTGGAGSSRNGERTQGGGNGGYGRPGEGHGSTGWKELDPVRPGRAARQIAEEILAQFTDRRGGRVKVVLEIEAEDPNGFDRQPAAATTRTPTRSASATTSSSSRGRWRLCRRGAGANVTPRLLGFENSVLRTRAVSPTPRVLAVESSEARFNVTRDARFQQ